MASTRSKTVALINALVIAGVALTGCSTADPLAAQYGAGDGKNYISGTGAITEIPTSERGAPVEFTSVDEAGNAIDAEQYRGEVLVVNFWYAACPPCRVEAPDLEAVYSEFQPENVAFLGVNTRDSAETATAFMKSLDVTYPSAVDVRGGAVQLAFAGDMAPNSTPTTMVLDREGRVASRILGQVDPGTLRTLVRETAEEEPQGGS